MLDVRCLCLYIINDELRRLVLETLVFRPQVISKAVKMVLELEIIAFIENGRHCSYGILPYAGRLTKIIRLFYLGDIHGNAQIKG